MFLGWSRLIGVTIVGIVGRSSSYRNSVRLRARPPLRFAHPADPCLMEIVFCCGYVSKLRKFETVVSLCNVIMILRRFFAVGPSTMRNCRHFFRKNGVSFGFLKCDLPKMRNCRQFMQRNNDVTSFLFAIGPSKMRNCRHFLLKKGRFLRVFEVRPSKI